MTRIIEWICQLERQIDDERDQADSNDLKMIKESFQNHEVTTFAQL
jgi:phage terminase Nu1 subunit (DNA packaging protein)